MQITANRRTQGTSKTEAGENEAVEGAEVGAVEDISSAYEYRWRIKAGTQAKSDGVDIQHPGLAVVGDVVGLVVGETVGEVVGDVVGPAVTGE